MNRKTYPLQLFVRQANAVLYANFIANTTVLAQDGDTLHFDTVLHDASSVASDGSRGALDSCPGSYAAVPANDRVENTSIMLDFRVFQYNRLLDSNSRADNDTRADGDVWPEFGAWVNFCCRMDENRR